MNAAPNLPTAAVVSPLACAACSIVDTSVSLPWYDSRTASSTTNDKAIQQMILLSFMVVLVSEFEGGRVCAAAPLHLRTSFLRDERSGCVEAGVKNGVKSCMAIARGSCYRPTHP